MSLKLKIEWRRDIPIEVLRLAGRRTRDMVYFYGRNITDMPILTLAASCYLQGIEDCQCAMRPIEETLSRKTE